jgi:dihydrofolate reductase
MIRIILHVDKEWGIGKRNGLMFNLPKDMAFFRNTTKGHIVVMGENTLLSFPGSKPLKNRTNIVLSADPTHEYEGCINLHTMDDLHKKMRDIYESGEDIYVIGGASIYRALLPYVDDALVTKVDAVGGADVFFPNLDRDPSFEMVEESEPQLDNGIPIRFCTYRNHNKMDL